VVFLICYVGFVLDSEETFIFQESLVLAENRCVNFNPIGQKLANLVTQQDGNARVDDDQIRALR